MREHLIEGTLVEVGGEPPRLRLALAGGLEAIVPVARERARELALHLYEGVTLVLRPARGGASAATEEVEAPSRSAAEPPCPRREAACGSCGQEFSEARRHAAKGLCRSCYFRERKRAKREATRKSPDETEPELLAGAYFGRRPSSEGRTSYEPPRFDVPPLEDIPPGESPCTSCCRGRRVVHDGRGLLVWCRQCGHRKLGREIRHRWTELWALADKDPRALAHRVASELGARDASDVLGISRERLTRWVKGSAEVPMEGRPFLVWTLMDATLLRPAERAPERILRAEVLAYATTEDEVLDTPGWA